MRRLLATACTAVATLLVGHAQEVQPKPTFSSESELVVLHVAVRDKKGAYVAGLERGSFHVSENKRPQDISFFHTQDSPVTVGMLIDSSGSMSPNRDNVIAASMAFSKAMNPKDEFFVLGFNEQIHAPLPAERPFTSDEPVLRVALVQAIKARGQTAIYNAVNAGLDYVQKGAYERQVLIVISDGGDNASAVTRAQVLANAQASNAVIYTIPFVDPLDSSADPGVLNELAESTGGVAFKPKRVSDIDAILQRVAHDIRNMYTIGYVPAESAIAKAEKLHHLRRVSVEVRHPDGQRFDVRTRRAYRLSPGEPEGDAR